jgi:hypothetical protein
MTKSIVVRIDNSERSFPGGGSIIGQQVYENFGYIGRSPCDLKVESYKFLVRSNGVFHSYDYPSSVNTVLDCIGTFETDDEIFDITYWERIIDIELKAGEIITVKFQGLDESIDYFELLLFGDQVKSNDLKTVIEEFDKSDEEFLSKINSKLNKIEEN